jgi:membrane protein DedA with SNARE-associated domain
MRAFLLHYMRQFTYGGVLVLLAVAGLGVPAPQDLTLLLAGYLIEHGLMSPSITVPVCIVGAVTGDALGFWLVRKGTARLRTVPLLGRVLTAERMARAQGALARHEAVTIALARNVPGLRTVVFATASATGTPFARFLLWDSLSAILNVALLLTLGYVFSHRLKMITREVSRVEHWIAFGVVALVVAWSLASLLRRRVARRTGVD